MGMAATGTCLVRETNKVVLTLERTASTGASLATLTVLYGSILWGQSWEFHMTHFAEVNTVLYRPFLHKYLLIISTLSCAIESEVHSCLRLLLMLKVRHEKVVLIRNPLLLVERKFAYSNFQAAPKRRGVLA